MILEKEVEEKEKEIKKCLEKQKTKQREFVEKNKLFLKKKKQEENKETEKELWAKLNALNKEFKDILEHEKS